MHREGNGNPLQCSCLENLRDGGAWWAAVSGVAQSWTRLKRFSSSSSRHAHMAVSTGIKTRNVYFYMLLIGVPTATMFLEDNLAVGIKCLKNRCLGEFPGGPVVRTGSFL